MGVVIRKQLFFALYRKYKYILYKYRKVFDHIKNRKFDKMLKNVATYKFPNKQFNVTLLVSHKYMAT